MEHYAKSRQQSKRKTKSSSDRHGGACGWGGGQEAHMVWWPQQGGQKTNKRQWMATCCCCTDCREEGPVHCSDLSTQERFNTWYHAWWCMHTCIYYSKYICALQGNSLALFHLILYSNNGGWFFHQSQPIRPSALCSGLEGLEGQRWWNIEQSLI